MKAKDVSIIVLIAIGLLLLWLFINEKKKAEMLDKMNAKLKRENQQLKQGYFSLLEKYLITQAKVGPDVITELQRLKSNIDQLTAEEHYELDSVIKMVNEGQGAKAIKDLAKIIENKIKEKVANDESFKKSKNLHNLLEHAKNCLWIKSRQFENGLLLKDIRNRESHELAVIEEPHQVGLAIFTGIDIIYSLAKN